MIAIFAIALVEALYDKQGLNARLFLYELWPLYRLKVQLDCLTGNAHNIFVDSLIGLASLLEMADGRRE
jgi:hypothetical protein